MYDDDIAASADCLLSVSFPFPALSLINTPVELLKIRQQASVGRPPPTLALIKSIWQNEGNIRGLYRGFTACWLRDIGFGPYFLT